MNPQTFPVFVRSLPKAKLPFDGFNGWLLVSDFGQMLFNESVVEVFVPEHSHGEQWGVVIDGSIDLQIGDQTKTFNRGDTYYIPNETPHSARIHAGCRAIDLFADKVNTHLPGRSWQTPEAFFRR